MGGVNDEKFTKGDTLKKSLLRGKKNGGGLWGL